MNQQQSKALELIEKAGLTQKHNQLIALGYGNPWLNYRLLQRHSGNVEKVESALKVGENLRRDKELFAQSILTSKGWIEKNNELIKKGFTSMKKNLKVLLKSNGDLQQAEIKLMKKFRKRMQNDEPLDQILSRNGFKIQYEKLMEMGYGDSKKNLKLLFKYNGNLETILFIYGNIDIKFVVIGNFKIILLFSGLIIIDKYEINFSIIITIHNIIQINSTVLKYIICFKIGKIRLIKMFMVTFYTNYLEFQFQENYLIIIYLQIIQYHLLNQ